MRLGLFANGWWAPAAERLGLAFQSLPIAEHPTNPHAADLTARIANGRAITAQLADWRGEPGALLDNGGAGLALVDVNGDRSDVRLAHELAGATLVSHFIDPVTTSFQGLDWSVAWSCLRSTNWIKAIWDRALVAELQRLGVPNVVHLPMAAPDRTYDTRPIEPTDCRYSVSFVGNQNTGYFYSAHPVQTHMLFAGALAHAARSDMPEASFHDVYHDYYHLAEPLQANDDLQTQLAKTAQYYNAKLYFHAALCIRNRDRFVIFLKQKLGEMFRLIGARWDQAYGLSCLPPLPTTDDYFRQFRETAININLVNGNAETGLNMRHFEITAAGGFMLCYDQPELRDHFVVGEECGVFRSEAELIDKIHYYLSHPQERCAMAAAGQQRTLSQHLYSHRLNTVLDWTRARFAADSPSGAIPAAQAGSTHAAESTKCASAAYASMPSRADFSSRHCDDDFQELLPDPDVILDCGANIGQMAQGLRRIYPKATIYCFEPVAAAFEQLTQAAERLGLRLVRKAVGDRDGKATMNLTKSPEACSLLDFQDGNPCAKWTRVVGREEVDICTLDRWCEDNEVAFGRVDLLKLDVQGAELQALYGARRLLKYVRLIYLEVAFVPIYLNCPLLADIDGFLGECGFRRHALYPSDQPHLWGDALYTSRKLETKN